MSHKKNAIYQAELRRKRREKGIVQVQVYVHETRCEEIREIAKNLQAPKAE